MPLALRFRPIFEFAPRVQGDEIIEELDVARLEIHVDRTSLDSRSVQRDRRLLRLRERRHARELLRFVDRGAEPDGAEIALRETEDRMFDPRLLARVHLAAARAIKILAQFLGQIRAL